MSIPTDTIFLESAIKLFRYYKNLGDGAMAQLTDEQLLARPNDASNSISLIVRHLSGNMKSRWTDFLTSDGEKPWRDRESEFSFEHSDGASLRDDWEQGWRVLLDSLSTLQPGDLAKIIYIRNEGQTVMEAIQRQLCHYPMHVGQIIFQAKALSGSAFRSLSIPKGESAAYNKDKFGQEKEIRHFTDRV